MLRSVSWLVVSASQAAILLAGVFFADARIAEASDKLPDQAALADAKEDVAQALLAETQGDNATRSKRLTKAWLAAPDLPEANWHLSRIRIADSWRPLAEVVSQAASDPNQEQYRSLRDKAAENPRALRELARWCTKLGWHDRARLHFAQLLANPKAEASQKSEAVEKLNLVQVGGNWLTRDEVAARQQEAKAIQESLAKWRPKLKTLQLTIDGDDFTQRDKAIAELAKLDDPAMIPALESFLLDAKADFQEQAVKKLASFGHYEATIALTRYAVLSDYATARDNAITALRRRPEHEFVPLLLSGLNSPLKSIFRITTNGGAVGHIHAIASESPTTNQLMMVFQLAIPSIRRSSNFDTSDVKTVPGGQPSQVNVDSVTRTSSVADAFRDQRASAATAAGNIESAVRLTNAKRQSDNRRVFEVLEGVTGQQHSRTPSVWWTWWETHNGYSWPKPTQYIFGWRRFQYSAQDYTGMKLSGTIAVSCFLAGTPIRTETGIVPIESIRPGDRVLAQDQDTGELAYKVVLTTTLRPPAKMVEIKAGGEEIYTTLGHPFWVAGRGWQMAKQLKAGDLLHGLAGATPIESVNPAGEHAAHNLVVDDSNTYFVGRGGMLVHDNEFRKPTRAIVPGLVRD